jgi:hypothetical protein
VGQPWGELAVPLPDWDPCDGTCPPGEDWLVDEACPPGEDGLVDEACPLEEACPCVLGVDWVELLPPVLPLAPLLPPLVGCDGNGDSVPLLVGLGLGLLLGLPLRVEGADDGEEGLGSWGSDGPWVAVVAEQPARPSAQAMGQKSPLRRGCRMNARVSRNARRPRLPRSAGVAQSL